MKCSGSLKWMSKSMRGGDWAIWGALANHQLQELARTGGAVEVDISSADELPEAVDRLEQALGWVSCHSYERLLRLCGDTGAIAEARRVHSHIAKSGREGDTFLGNLLIEMYGKLGCVVDARAAFEKIHQPNLFSRNIMLAVYCKQRLVEEAEELFLPAETDSVAWNTLLAAYAHCGHIESGMDMFLAMPVKNLISWNTILALHADSQQAGDTKAVFGKMPEHNVVSWNSLLQAFALKGQLLECQDCFQLMPEKDLVSWTELLRATAQLTGIDDLEKLFSQMPHWNSTAWLVMIQAYGEAGEMARARSVFDRIPERNLLLWNAMISACAQADEAQSAKECFDSMPAWDVVSWNTMLTAYGSQSMVRHTKSMFDEMPERDEVSWNIIIQSCDSHLVFQRAPQRSLLAWNSMLASCMQRGELEQAESMFQTVMPSRNFVSWSMLLQGYVDNEILSKAEKVFGLIPSFDCVVLTLMISGYAKVGCVEEAKHLMKRMPEPDLVAWNVLLHAVAERSKLEDAKETFDEMPRRDVVSWSIFTGACIRRKNKCKSLAVFERMPQRDLVSCNAMVVFLADIGDVTEAKLVMESMGQRNIVSWNCLLQGCVKNGRGREAVEIYKLMDLDAVVPEKQTYVWILEACARNWLLNQGRIVHSDIIHLQLLRTVAVSTALVEMYGRCGELEQARKVFDAMPCRSVATWNTMLNAYAQHGQGDLAMELFMFMGLDGLSPNALTFVLFFSACSHSGMVSTAWDYFAAIRCDFGDERVLHPNHYACLVDMLGRAGLVEQAEDLIGLMPVVPDKIAWTSLLGACKAHGDSSRGEAAAKQLVQLEPQSSSVYVTLCNMHRSSNS